MPFELLDLVLGGIMLLSGLLALTRGFTREVLSLISWGLAAAAGLFASFNEDLVALALDYVQSDVIARVAVGGGVFLIALIILSIISVRIADWVLDSAAGPFDRTFGLVYGLARGLLLVAIAYLFYVWLVPPEGREDWVRNARSLPVIEATGEFVVGFLPADIRDTLQARIAAAGAAPQARQEPIEEGNAGDEGYTAPDSTVLEQLIERTRPGGEQQQDQGQGQQQDQPLFGGEQQN
jgi:membrane protein required for colicin V production